MNFEDDYKEFQALQEQLVAKVEAMKKKYEVMRPTLSHYEQSCMDQICSTKHMYDAPKSIYKMKEKDLVVVFKTDFNTEQRCFFKNLEDMKEIPSMMKLQLQKEPSLFGDEENCYYVFYIPKDENKWRQRLRSTCGLVYLDSSWVTTSQHEKETAALEPFTTTTSFSLFDDMPKPQLPPLFATAPPSSPASGVSVKALKSQFEPRLKKAFTNPFAFAVPQ